MEHGTVTTVKFRDGVTYCNVEPIRTDTEYKNIPVMKPHSGFIQIPEQGEKVAMHKLEGDRRFISHILGTKDGQPSDMENLNEGELSLKFDSETEVSIRQDGEGGYDLAVSASGDVTIDAESVSINGIDFDSHTHTQSDGSETSEPS